MKKKIKDFTLGEVQAICKKHKKCSKCPFDKYCIRIMNFMNDHSVSEEEVEIDDK